ncbi:hypothetical protein JIP62_12380 [Brevundimonas vitis]|uniref:Flagellar protein FliT n=1 Tax=Brevundimonas vitisensis TaxID=2800818 RepID=A0ABX7BLI6_9CAUL|nr:hypothetical protein [Brevundimonas vitisensis]QQQ18096.1 hypothetical protein JIP62_12380 [Brevundimonas vitisensis]
MTEMSRLLTAMRDELGDWAAASERLEHVIGDVLVGRRLTEVEIEAVQALDGLSQHLRQLSLLCGDISGASVDHQETADHIRAAVARLNLSGLGRRLAGLPPVPMASAGSGEAELW